MTYITIQTVHSIIPTSLFTLAHGWGLIHLYWVYYLPGLVNQFYTLSMTLTKMRITLCQCEELSSLYCSTLFPTCSRALANFSFYLERSYLTRFSRDIFFFTLEYILFLTRPSLSLYSTGH